jgi:chromosome segregation ATPase
LRVLRREMDEGAAMTKTQARTPEERAREIVDKAWGAAEYLRLEERLIRDIAAALREREGEVEKAEKMRQVAFQAMHASEEREVKATEQMIALRAEVERLKEHKLELHSDYLPIVFERDALRTQLTEARREVEGARARTAADSELIESFRDELQESRASVAVLVEAMKKPVMHHSPCKRVPGVFCLACDTLASLPPKAREFLEQRERWKGALEAIAGVDLVLAEISESHMAFIKTVKRLASDALTDSRGKGQR